MNKYDKIVSAIRGAKLNWLEKRLAEAVEDETDALLVIQKDAAAFYERNKLQRFTRPATTRTNFTEDAKIFYGDEIWEAVQASELAPLTADQILNHRRMANVWAIATKLREAGITLKDEA